MRTQVVMDSRVKCRTLGRIFVSLLALGHLGCAGLNDPGYGGYGGGPYGAPPPAPYYGNAPYYGGGYYGNDPYRRDRKEIERERERLEEERRRLERERDRYDSQRPAPGYRPPPAPERCPSGFSPSEQKCSAEERRRGCRDMRMPSGLGCVSRR